MTKWGLLRNERLVTFKKIKTLKEKKKKKTENTFQSHEMSC